MDPGYGDFVSTSPDRSDGNQKHADLSLDLGISAGVAALFLLLRVLAVSEWDWHTAADVAETIDFGDAIPLAFGTLFAWPALTGALLVIVLPLALISILRSGRGAVRQLRLSDLVLVAAAMAGVAALVTSLNDWWVLVCVVVLPVVFVGVWLLNTHEGAQAITTALTRRVGLIGIMGVLVIAAVVDTPWMSRESMVTTAGEFEVYVLETEPGFLKVLTVDGRQFEIIDTSTVLSRTVVD